MERNKEVSVHLISYDLKSPEGSSEYEPLIGKIKSYSGWCKPEYSLWLISTSKTASTVRDELKAFIDSNDKLLVVSVDGDNWASYNLPTKVVEWMQEHV